MVAKEFDGLEYTREALAEEISLMERHARDGSAVLGGCSCIEEKHLLLIAGLASEGVTLAKDQAEKEYYMNLADKARAMRMEILDGDFGKSQKSHGVSKCEGKIEKCMADGHSEEECRATIPCR
jgi:hypothetical protein